MNVSGESCGVLYLATGEKYIKEAEKSAQSVKEKMDIPVAIATDEDVSDIFDGVIEYNCATETVNGRSWLLNSTIPPNLSPFDRTLYLDSDTLIRQDVTELFDLLNNYELGIARVPEHPRVNGFPKTHTLLNCGVIVYKDSPGVKSVFRNWKQEYQQEKNGDSTPQEQPAFARALYKSNIDWYCLPREYNVRVPRRGMLSGKIKIIHGRHRQGLEQVAKDLEPSTKPRVFRERSKYATPTHTVKDRGSLQYHIESTRENYTFKTVCRIGIDFVVDRLFGTNRMQKYSEFDLG